MKNSKNIGLYVIYCLFVFVASSCVDVQAIIPAATNRYIAPQPPSTHSMLPVFEIAVDFAEISTSTIDDQGDLVLSLHSGTANSAGEVLGASPIIPIYVHEDSGGSSLDNDSLAFNIGIWHTNGPRIPENLSIDNQDTVRTSAGQYLSTNRKLIFEIKKHAGDTFYTKTIMGPKSDAGFATVYSRQHYNGPEDFAYSTLFLSLGSIGFNGRKSVLSSNSGGLGGGVDRGTATIAEMINNSYTDIIGRATPLHSMVIASNHPSWDATRGIPGIGDGTATAYVPTAIHIGIKAPHWFKFSGIQHRYGLNLMALTCPEKIEVVIRVFYPTNSSVRRPKAFTGLAPGMIYDRTSYIIPGVLYKYVLRSDSEQFIDYMHFSSYIADIPKAIVHYKYGDHYRYNLFDVPWDEETTLTPQVGIKLLYRKKQGRVPDVNADYLNGGKTI